ncbi:MAG: phosphoglycerate kinase [bacterium]|nr:phosphoglycerate kinase [bacterium]
MYFLSKLKGDLNGKVVLLRLDLNVEKVKDALRLSAALPTIKLLLKKKARVLIISHRGRPARREPALSLKFCLNFFEKQAGRKIKFFKDIPAVLPVGQLFVLENLRFWPGEQKGDIKFAQKLAKLGDLYVNDAFGTVHRADASVVKLPKLLPAYAGLLLEKEIKVLKSVMRSPRKPLVLIFGGAKVKDKLPVIKKLLPKATTVLLGSSAINNRKSIPKSKKIWWPLDWLTDNGQPLDIGPLTVAAYRSVIKKAKTIIWNGPVGYFENKRFAVGSVAIANAVVAGKAMTIIGGGETTMLVQGVASNNKLASKKNLFLSTGGGAMLEFLSGKELPGIKALK